MSRTNALREPETPSASVTAASLPDSSSRPRIRSETFIRSPGCRPILDSIGEALYFAAVNVSESLASSSVSSAVISFVVEPTGPALVRRRARRPRCRW